MFLVEGAELALGGPGLGLDGDAEPALGGPGLVSGAWGGRVCPVPGAGPAR